MLGTHLQQHFVRVRQDIPRAGISTERERYSVGDEVSVTLDVQAGRNPIAFDGYLQILRNGQRFRFVSSKGLSDSPTPFVISSSTAGHYEFILSFWIPPDFLPGSYTLQALLFKAGASLGSIGGRHNRLFGSQSSMFTVSDRLRPAAVAPAIARVQITPPQPSVRRWGPKRKSPDGRP